MKKTKKKRKRRENKIGNLTKKILGIIFVIVGIAGLFLPIIQGILLIVVGLALYHDKSIREILKKAIKKLKKGEKNPLKLAEL